MRQSGIISGLAALVALGAWASLYFSLHGSGPSFDPTPHEAIGHTLAQQALALVRPSGRITVIARDTATFANPASESQLAGFRKTLRAAHGTVHAIRHLELDPLRPTRVPPGDFFELLRRAREGDVIVSLVGPPLLTDSQREQLGPVKPAVVAFCSGSLPELVDLKLLFEQGLLQAAVVVNPAARQSAAGTFNAGKSGDAYVAVTRANLSDLPVSAAARSE